ncbi:NXPE family member 3-like [Antedon mediterranea]|uniref:NXPE family member 3-like n=1 Tax=Antedon mediterranea TaxID=105859 RepID=UPI003AF805D6
MWKKEKRIFWSGIYECNTDSEEYTLCYIEKHSNRENIYNVCLYTNVEALGNTTLTCEKPKTCLCNNLVSYRGSGEDILNEANLLLGNNTELFKGKNLEFYVVKDYEIYLGDPGHETMQERVIDSEDVQSDGVWMNNEWKSYQCNNSFKNINQDLKSCMRHTNISLLGDSTFRQWFHELVNIYNGDRYENALQMFHRVEDYDIDITFNFHPLCILSEQRIIPFANMQFEGDLIREMSDCNRVIVVGPWAHYGQWTEQSYLDRLYGIKHAVVDFLKRCPEATVAVKGSHPRNHKSIYFYMFGNDYIFSEYNILLYKVFEGSGAVFLDVWDMNLSFYTPNKLHMPRDVIRQEMNLLFGCHICR